MTGPVVRPGSRPPPGAARRAVIAWCLYDTANSAIPAVITTFVFATYFTQAVAVDATTGTAQWSMAVTLSALAVALLSPALGAIADAAGRRKPWLLFFTAVSVLGCALLWFVPPTAEGGTPGPGVVLYALIVFGVVNAAFEMAIVFYNAMLPDLVPPARLGRLSGWAWGAGYAGGLVCLVVVLFAFVQADPVPFGLDKAMAEHVRASGPISGLWYALFALPLFFWTPDRKRTGLGAGTALRQGLSTLANSLRNLRSYGGVLRYLIARMLYTDGLNTLFAFGGIYAAGTFGMAIEEVLMFGIALNVTAGLGAFGFAWIDDAIGAKPTVVIALVAIMAISTGLLIVESKDWFWGLGLCLGAFFGPAQAASRSLMARLAPREMAAEMFGLYALSGKATTFMGPMVLGWVTLIADSQRVGMATILIFLVAGLILLLGVREPRSGKAPTV
ncbi:MAG: MFS transporter [Rhodospirillaceae bacterium]|jgi:MFS transporter, UMF1 family|nr:MFS transporter [Rhodospirillaceae bacterium]MBT6116967.1 MFS transporter [Rhodospirillaceae bacterium]